MFGGALLICRWGYYANCVGFCGVAVVLVWVIGVLLFDCLSFGVV